MNFKVYAHAAEEYEKWLAGGKVTDLEPRESSASSGQKLFFSMTCVNCHAIDGTDATATIGPNLTSVANRKELGGGVLENSTENLGLWLKNPQAIKPGCKMPDFRLSNIQVQHLVAYLESLR